MAFISVDIVDAWPSFFALLWRGNFWICCYYLCCVHFPTADSWFFSLFKTEAKKNAFKQKKLLHCGAHKCWWTHRKIKAEREIEKSHLVRIVRFLTLIIVYTFVRSEKAKKFVVASKTLTRFFLLCFCFCFLCKSFFFLFCFDRKMGAREKRRNRERKRRLSSTFRNTLSPSFMTTTKTTTATTMMALLNESLAQRNAHHMHN